MKKYMTPGIEYVEILTPDIMAFSVNEGAADFTNTVYTIEWGKL